MVLRSPQWLDSSPGCSYSEKKRCSVLIHSSWTRAPLVLHEGRGNRLRLSARTNEQSSGRDVETLLRVRTVPTPESANELMRSTKQQLEAARKRATVNVPSLLADVRGVAHEASDSFTNFMGDGGDGGETSDNEEEEAGSSMDEMGLAPTTTGRNKAQFEVLKLSDDGSNGLSRIRRRSLLREHRLLHRDFRRIDPSVDFTKTSPTIAVRENVLLLCVGGVRAIVTANEAFIFEPKSDACRQFFDIVAPNLELRRQGGGVQQLSLKQCFLNASDSHSEYMDVVRQTRALHGHGLPFELVVLEGALLVATGHFDSETRKVVGEVQNLLANLPGNVNPVNLEELRRVKSSLVELESKAETVRKVLEDLMDDDDEKRDLNLSSRPMREDRRRQREREKLRRELERATEAKGYEDEDSVDSSSRGMIGVRDRTQAGRASTSAPEQTYGLPADLQAGLNKDTSRMPEASSSQRQKARLLDKKQRGTKASQGWASRLELREDNFHEAQDALEDMVEQEQEEEDIERVEDVLEYYHQQASSTQLEAERMLQEARDLEESISVTLSAARYEVNRLQLMLSIGSFSASVGAVTAGIFGMNMHSNLEGSVEGFWGATFVIIVGCIAIFSQILQYTRNRRIF